MSSSSSLSTVSSSSSSSTSSSASSSSAQYLTPEFFPPTIMDAKNSPLALLVQTCSLIGRDSQTAKPPGNDKKEPGMQAIGSHSSKETPSRLKSSPASDKPTKGEDKKRSSYHNGSDSHGKKDQANNINNNRSSNLNGTKSSPNKSCFKAPPLNSDRVLGIPEKYSNGLFNSYALDKFATDENGPVEMNHRLMYSNAIPSKLNGAFPYVDSTSDYLAKSPFYPLYNSMKLQEAAVLQNGFPPSTGPLGGLYPSFLNFPLTLDPLAAAAVVYSANIAAQVAAAAGHQKPSPSSGTHASGSLRRCSGSCKDPFCPGQHPSPSTSLNGHSPGSQQCTNAGCNQCNEKINSQLGSSSISTPSSSAASALFYPGCSSVPGSSFCLSPFSPLLVPGGIASPLLNPPLSCNPTHPHPHSQQQQQQQQQGLICNWVQGGEYCGKRFSTSEDLLLHLHGHTAVPSSQAPSSPLDLVHQKQLQPLSPFSQSALPPLPFSLQSYFGASTSRSLSASRSSPLPSYALPLMPPHQRNSMSPSSLFTSSRYHPYKSSVTPPGFSSSHQQGVLPGSFPSLAAYYSPYAVYNQRLNSATAVGP